MAVGITCQGDGPGRFKSPWGLINTSSAISEQTLIASINVWTHNTWAHVAHGMSRLRCFSKLSYNHKHLRVKKNYSGTLSMNRLRDQRHLRSSDPWLSRHCCLQRSERVIKTPLKKCNWQMSWLRWRHNGRELWEWHNKTWGASTIKKARARRGDPWWRDTEMVGIRTIA